VFGALLAQQIAEMAEIVARAPADRAGHADPHGQAVISGRSAGAAFDLVEAGAGNGRLAADILQALQRSAPSLYARTQLHLVEASAAARAAQRNILGDVSDRLIGSSEALPARFEGVLIANELLDAMPVHQVVMRETGLHEVYVSTARRGGRLVMTTVEGPPSTPALAEYLSRAEVELEPGWRAEINLAAIAWIRDVALRLRRGYVVLIDYGREARELYSVTHSTGTLTTFSRHSSAGPESDRGQPSWLRNPGEQDITAHVDFTSIRRAAETQGLNPIAFLDQTYFLMGILASKGTSGSAGSQGSIGPQSDLKSRLALKTLLIPGGLGSTMKVMILGKGVGAAPLAGCSYRVRIT
jgi:SAM-dependent MidA family methyltransferase